MFWLAAIVLYYTSLLHSVWTDHLIWHTLLASALTTVLVHLQLYYIQGEITKGLVNVTIQYIIKRNKQKIKGTIQIMGSLSKSVFEITNDLKHV